MNVLVVDDDEMVRYVLSEKLGEAAFSVTTAHNGLLAVELFHDTVFDAVLLDLKMPGMDGIETLKELSKHDPGIPVIMVTGFGDIATAVEAIKLGAYDFVEKPPQLSRIMVTLRRAIEKAALEREVRDLGKSVEESIALKQAYQKLRELDQVKTTFLTSVSHELRTPLTSIIGYAEVSRKKLKKWMAEDINNSDKIGQLGENLETIILESEKLAGMIESILDLTAMEAGTAEWKWDAIPIKEVIEDAAAIFSPIMKEKGIEFVVVFENDLPSIMGDRYRFSKVVKQILSNAVNFTDQGRVVCSTKRVNNDLFLTVSDTGIGIDPSRHLVIFEKFSQIGDALTEKPKGVGLGLPISRLIVEYHGGSITVESEPGKGSVFTVMLPVVEGNNI
ncbi:MAG: hybrid sensor histidine kinase/response regulator [Desulfuromonadaceae bacterium]|nr:hybrid sensor histidine kinase/response regulator [Desulfuromonadaceae bacterium]